MFANPQAFDTLATNYWIPLEDDEFDVLDDLREVYDCKTPKDFLNDDFRGLLDKMLESTGFSMADVKKSNLFDVFEAMMDNIRQIEADNPGISFHDICVGA
jgi:hypothetical protein